MVRTSKTMLKSSGKSGHPWLVPDLSGNSFSFSPLRMMFAVGLSCYVEVGSHYAHFLKGFLSEVGVGFCQRLFLCLLGGSYCFYSSV